MRYTQDMIAVMQAFCDGKPIEHRWKIGIGGSDWEHSSTPTWNWELCDYRIKKTKKTYYMSVSGPIGYDNSRITTRLYQTKAGLIASGYQPESIVEVTFDE